MTDRVQEDIRRQVCEAQNSWRRESDNENKRSMPFVTLTYAQSIDGSLTVDRGTPTLLSGPASLQMTHMIRTLHDGIMVGVGTILADNPSLNARLVKGSNPRPIILDTHLRCPSSIKLFTMPTCEKPFILFGHGSQDIEIVKRKEMLEAVGARVLECKTIVDNDNCIHVDLFDALRLVKEYGMNSVMVEGGAAILTSCLQIVKHRHFIDLVVVTIAPTFIGGLRAVGTLLAPTDRSGSIFPRLQQPYYHVLENDLVILGRIKQ